MSLQIYKKNILNSECRTVAKKTRPVKYAFESVR